MQTDAGGDLIVVGQLRGAYGIRGWLHVGSFTDPASNLLDYRPWLVRHAGGWREVAVRAVRAHGKGFVAQLEGCDDREAAAALAGCEIAVPRAELPAADEDEYYWRDLEGLQVQGGQGEALGTVVQMMPTGANDVMVVRDHERERLIPFIRQVVSAVDLKAGVIHVDWDPEF